MSEKTPATAGTGGAPTSPEGFRGGTSSDEDEKKRLINIIKAELLKVFPEGQVLPEINDENVDKHAIRRAMLGLLNLGSVRRNVDRDSTEESNAKPEK